VQEVAAAAGYPVVLGFDVDPLDYQDPGGSLVASRTLATVRAGSVVSMHFSHAGTVAAMPAILDGLAAKGLVPVTASTLFGYA
jgi:peptidoglycan/xylan/chitin deacetylase (PgdA/CDA1 family)